MPLKPTVATFGNKTGVKLIINYFRTKLREIKQNTFAKKHPIEETPRKLEVVLNRLCIGYTQISHNYLVKIKMNHPYAHRAETRLGTNFQNRLLPNCHKYRNSKTKYDLSENIAVTLDYHSESIDILIRSLDDSKHLK